MDFKNANELLTLCEEQSISISEVMRNREIITGECPAKETDQKMVRVLEIMKEAARSPIEKPIRSMGGLIGGEAQKLAQHSASGQGLCGELLEKAITYAMATLETNASMGLIVLHLPPVPQALFLDYFSLFRRRMISLIKKFNRHSSMQALSVTSPCEMPLLPVLSEGVRLRSVLHQLWQHLPLLNLWVELQSNVWMPLLQFS